jgi:hypothetical protein
MSTFGLSEKDLVTLLIFGTGFLAALLWGLGTVVRAFRCDAGNSAAIRSDLAAMERRLAVLERQVAAVAGPAASN